MRKYLISLAVAALIVLPSCGSVSGPVDTTTPEQTSGAPLISPTTSPPSIEQTTGGPSTYPTTPAPTTPDPDPIDPSPTDPLPAEPTDPVPPDEQAPAEATSIDGSMSLELPDDWRYAPELETAYSVFSWMKEDTTQNLSMAPLGPWTQIESPEIYLDQLIEAGNLGDATATLQGDYSVDGYDGFWMTVEGPGYVANIYYIDVNGGIKEITANALHSQGLEQIDRLVQTIEFH